MHSLTVKWSNLNQVQRGQVKTHFSEEIKRKEVFEHTLNRAMYHVNPLSGKVLFL